MQSRADENINATFERLFEVIRSEQFLGRKGLGNELPFFISPYHPALQGKVEELVPILATKLANQGVVPLHVDLYDLTVEIMNARGVWTRMVEKEPKIEKEQFLKTIANVTDAKETLVPLIATKLAAAECQVMLITGVGLVYPYVRSHKVLENLQAVAKMTPTVLFLPGDYCFDEGKGSYIRLFGVLPDDPYYRAFNIADFHP